MPYSSIDQLPKAVADHLPIHAQEIFMAAFNHALVEYADRIDPELTAFRVAWAAVKKATTSKARSGCETDVSDATESFLRPFNF